MVAVLLLVAINPFTASAQYEKGTKDLNIGVGLIRTFGFSGETSSVPPLSASFEVGTSDNLSFGGYVGYASQSYNRSSYYGSDVSVSYFLFGPRMGYHFALIPKADTYVGAMIGYGAATVSVTSSSGLGTSSTPVAAVSSFVYSVHGGIRYPFSPKIGGFAEIGYGISVLNLGLNAKF